MQNFRHPAFKLISALTFLHHGIQLNASFFLFCLVRENVKRVEYILGVKPYVSPKRQPHFTPLIPTALYHVLLSPADTFKTRCSLIFHYGNMLPQWK